MIEISDILNLMGEDGMETSVKKMVALANKRGGSDNISAILVEIL